MSFTARAVIRLGAIKHNFRLLKERAGGARMMAVIKANAYGHGLLPVAASLDEADCLAVARVPEAETLRSGGIESPIAVLGGVMSESELDQAVNLDLQLVVHTPEQVDWLERYSGGKATVWLKVDTGMNRLGFRPQEVASVIERLKRCAAVADLRMMTQFANADDVEDTATEDQINRFADIAQGFDGHISVANSAAILAWQDPLQLFAKQRDEGRLWSRAGLSLYGISPFRDKCGADLGLQPAMRFESSLIAVKTLGKGEPVGYGGRWHADRETVLGIVAAGYGDGYTRYIPPGSPVVINGRHVRLAGVISMDLTAVDLGPGAQDQVGDSVLLWGDELPVEEVAISAGTIPYQLVCGVSDRVEYRFADEG